MQEGDAGLPDANGPLWPAGAGDCRVQVRCYERYGRPDQFAKTIGVRYPLAIAAKDVREKFGGIEGLPTTMLYGRAVILRRKVVGFEYASVFEAELKPLL